MIPPKAKKQFGQHFLTNVHIAQRMADQLQGLGAWYDDVLEIGPGKGILTQALLAQKDIRLWPVEVDKDMSAFLQSRFPSIQPYLIQKDCLKLDIAASIGEQPIAIVGNFPYNISSQIIFKTLNNVQQIPELLGMFQKEVGERLVANPGSKTYGILSVLVRSYYHPYLLFKLKPGAFDPPPKVESAVIQLIRHSRYLPDIDEDLFFQVVKKAFNQRRKKLRNSLKLFLNDLSVIPGDFLDKRPEEIEPIHFQQITKAISQARE